MREYRALTRWHPYVRFTSTLFPLHCTTAAPPPAEPMPVKPAWHTQAAPVVLPFHGVVVLGGQAVHAVEPSASEKVPSVHSRHDVWGVHPAPEVVRKR